MSIQGMRRRVSRNRRMEAEIRELRDRVDNATRTPMMTGTVTVADTTTGLVDIMDSAGQTYRDLPTGGVYMPAVGDVVSLLKSGNAPVVLPPGGSGLKSFDYVTLVSGWQITAEGDAEFNNVLIRGLLVASEILSSQIVAPESANILPNGTFDVDVAGWTGNNTTPVRATGIKRTGAGSMELTATASGDMYAETTTGLGGFPVMEQRYYAPRIFTMPGTVVRGLTLTLRFWDAAGAFISSSISATYYGDPGLTDWSGVGGLEVEAPLGAVRASLMIKVLNASAGEVHRFDDGIVRSTSKLTGFLESAPEGPRGTLDGPSIFLRTGRDGEVKGFIWAIQDPTGGFASIAMLPPKYGTVGTEHMLTSEDPLNPTASPATSWLYADRAVNIGAQGGVDPAKKITAYVGGYKPTALLLDRKSLRHASVDTAISVTGTTLTEIGGGSLRVVFEAPASGKVIIRMSGLADMDGACHFFWGLKVTGGAAVALSQLDIRGASSEFYAWRAYYEREFTGLTPGAALDWTWAIKTDNAARATRMYHGPTYGDLFMSVWGIME